MLRLLPLLSLGLLGACFALVSCVVIEARRPRRATAGWALARGWRFHPDGLNSSWREHEFALPGGARAPAWLIDGGGARGTVLMLHGWSRSRIDSLRRIAPYQDRVRQLVLMDLRGHGDSAVARASMCGNEVRDIVAIVKSLSQAKPGEPLILVGHSLGAALAIRAAALSESAVSGVVAYSPYSTIRQPLAGRLSQHRLPSAALAYCAQLVLHCWGGRETPTELAAARLSCPLLVVHGEQDQIVSEKICLAIADAGRGVFSRESAVHGEVGVQANASVEAALELMLRR